MFPDAGRILRTHWASTGLAHLRGKRPEEITTADVAKAFVGEAEAVQLLAEEVATLLSGVQPLNHQGRTQVSETWQTGADLVGALEATNHGHPDGYAAIFRGRVKFIPPLEGGTSGPGLIYWALADFNWVESGGNRSYVDCTIVDARDDYYYATPDDPKVRVYLCTTAGRSPNVRAGEIISFCLDQNGEAIAISGYQDDPIGTVKVIDGEAAIPGGWSVLVFSNGRTLKGYVRGSETEPNGALGGKLEHTHLGHPGADFGSHSGYNTGTGGAADWTLTLDFEGTAETGELEPVSEPIAGGSSGLVETGLNTPSNEPHFVLGEESPGTILSDSVRVYDPGHHHGFPVTSPLIVVIPGTENWRPPFFTQRSITDMTFNGSEVTLLTSTTSETFFEVEFNQGDFFEGVTIEWPHTHWLDFSDTTDFVTTPHSHSLTMTSHTHPSKSYSGTLTAHSHGIPAINHDTGEDGLAHSLAKHLPPYKVAQWITRVR